MRVGEEYRGLISDGFLTFKPSRSILYNDTLRFTSSDKNIVSVNSRGYLAANSVGTAKITVEARDGSGVKFSFKVKVIEAQKAK